MSHTQTQGWDTQIDTPTHFFCKAFSLTSITRTEQAGRNEMFGAHSDMFKAKGVASSLKLDVGDYAISTSAFSMVR